MNSQKCPRCGNPTGSDSIRCPRCNKLLLSPCCGNCSKCQAAGKCR